MELASDDQTLDGRQGIPERARDLKRCAREVALKGVFVEEHSAVVLGGHVEVLREGTVSDETRPLLYADHMPRSNKVRSQ